ncbi:MAG: hypothetical protein ACKO40_02800, partial [Planctomycetaceae bacterium]
MPRRAIVTLVTRNYAHYAQVLVASCRAAHPDAAIFVCYADRPPADWREAVPGTHVVHGDELGVADWRRFSFQYTPFELSCALKPHLLQHVLDLGYDEVVYLDGDMRVYGPLASVFEALKHSSLVITPHLLAPLPDDRERPHEQAFLVSGTYNAGFLAVRRDDTTQRFLDWWAAMVAQRCITDLSASLFVDQKWLDLVPGMFPGVHVLRDPGCNAGHWTLSQFRFEPLADTSRTCSGVAVGGAPLVLFHFSRMTPAEPDDYLNSQSRIRLTDAHPLRRLVRDYHAALEAAGRGRCEAWGCGFDSLSDGTPIQPSWREAVRRRHPAVAAIDDPFDAASSPRLSRLYRGLEAEAVEWRRDWRIKSPQSRGISPGVRRAKTKTKKSPRVLL